MVTVIRLRLLPLLKRPDWNNNRLLSGLNVGCVWSGLILWSVVRSVCSPVIQFISQILPAKLAVMFFLSWVETFA